MTNLETLIAEQTQRTTVLTVANTVDHIAESIAREILSDPAVREELRQMVLAAFKATWADMQKSAAEK